MRKVGVYLVYAAVALRALVVFPYDPQRTRVVILLAIYGLFLLAEPWVFRLGGVHLSGWADSEPVLSKFKTKPLLSLWLPLGYLAVQTGLVVGVMRVLPLEDFFANLFIPLSLQAVLFFGRRLGLLCIAFYSLAMAGPLLSSEEGMLFGLAMIFLYSGTNFLFGGYAYQVEKAERARNQNQRTFDELQSAYRQLQGYAGQVEALAAEHERNRLARELHDSVTQTVFSMNLTVQSARLLLERESARVAGQLERLEELAAGAMREIQTLVAQLRPRSIAEEGLPVALRRLVGERQTRDGLQVTVEISGDQVLSEPKAAGLYRIAQEALTNVVKHARTSQVTVRLSLLPGEHCLEIEDQGIGFDPQSVLNQRGHLGLASMAERAREMGYNLAIDSRPGEGTRLRVAENPSEAMP
jgi:signal transduction histidine kinase